MNKNPFRKPLQLTAAFFALVGAQLCNAQVAHFDQITDTIAFAGDTTLGTAATFEAVLTLSDSDFNHASVFFEQSSGREDKRLYLNASSLGGNAVNVPLNPTGLQAAVPISFNVFHHIAFVRDGGEERVYLDGGLVASRTVTGDIGNWPQADSWYPGAIGASVFDRTTVPARSFIGCLETVRVSDTARYSGTSFTAPTGDLTTDANTLLLYNFNPEEISGNTVTDLSGNGHSGTFGTGFTGATSPTIGTREGCVAGSPPVARCKNVTVSAGCGISANASIDDGSSDPDSDTLAIVQTPAGPYPLGETTVTLTVTDPSGASDTCTSIVTVVQDLFAVDGIIWHQPLARSGASEDTDPGAGGTLKYRFKLGSTIPIKVHAQGCSADVTPNANVSGRVTVFGDTDCDGVVDAGELPIDYNGVGEAGGVMDKIDGHLKYNLDTKKLPQTVKCYILQVTVTDSSTGESRTESVPLQAK